MVKAISSGDVRRVKNEAIGADGETLTTYITNFFGAVNRSDGSGPQGFLLEAGPHFVIAPHFHAVDQFQIVVEGGGRVGKHGTEPVSIHYANGFTSYGPIVAAGEGLAFYTLRARADVGAHWMPGSRHEMERRPRRGLVAETALRPGAAPLADGVAVEDPLPPTDDGLRARTVRLAPHASCDAPESGGDGQYLLVVNGTWTREGTELGPRSLVFVDAGEAGQELRAGAAGLDVLLLQFPRVDTYPAPPYSDNG